jgi:hypothetical protein
MVVSFVPHKNSMEPVSYTSNDSNRTNSAWILSISANNSPVYVTRLRTISLHEKSIAIGIFLSKLLQIWPEQCGYIQYMPYLAL